MPARAWLLHFPDDDATEIAPRPKLPAPGEEILAGWIVADYTVGKSGRNAVDIWVTAKKRRRTIRSRTDRP